MMKYWESYKQILNRNKTMKDWRLFKEIDFNDTNIKSIHVDTRDFHCLATADGREGKFDLSEIDLTPENFYHTIDEIKALLGRFYLESGGDGGWRFFNLTGVENWNMKYIRIFKYDLGFLVFDSHKNILDKNFLNRSVEQDHLRKH